MEGSTCHALLDSQSREISLRRMPHDFDRLSLTRATAAGTIWPRLQFHGSLFRMVAQNCHDPEEEAVKIFA
jgi:hypothetical protein